MVSMANNVDTIIEAQCRVCNRCFVIMANRDDLIEWMEGGVFIQDILEYLTAGERELLISNTCSLCFDKIFGRVDNAKYHDTL